MTQGKQAEFRGMMSPPPGQVPASWARPCDRSPEISTRTLVSCCRSSSTKKPFCSVTRAARRRGGFASPVSLAAADRILGCLAGRRGRERPETSGKRSAELLRPLNKEVFPPDRIRAESRRIPEHSRTPAGTPSPQQRKTHPTISTRAGEGPAPRRRGRRGRGRQAPHALPSVQYPWQQALPSNRCRHMLIYVKRASNARHLRRGKGVNPFRHHTQFPQTCITPIFSINIRLPYPRTFWLVT